MNGLNSGPLVRLDENTFAETSRGNGERALRYERSDHRIWFDVKKWKISGSAWSDKKVIANREHKRSLENRSTDELETSVESAINTKSDAVHLSERIEYRIIAPVENSIRKFALISESGTREFFGNTTLSISSAESEAGRLLHHDNRTEDRSDLWLEAWISKDRQLYT